MDKNYSQYPWTLVSRGADLSGVATSSSELYGRGLAATYDVQSGDIVFKLPASLIADSSLIATQATGFAHADLILASLLLEASALAEHDWSDYAAAVPPRLVDLPIWWNAFPNSFNRTLSYIRRSKRLSGLHATALASSKLLTGTHAKFAQLYASHPSKHVRRAVCDRRSYARAVAWVGSRAFALPGTGRSGTHQHKALVPVLDLLNHPSRLGASSNVEWTMTTTRSVAAAAQQTSSEDYLIVRAISSIKAGDPLLHDTYGSTRFAASDSGGDADVDFFLTYGFVPELVQQNKPQLAKALARVSRLAAEESQIEGEEADEGGWPELPPFCLEPMSTLRLGKQKAKRKRKRRRSSSERAAQLSPR